MAGDIDFDLSKILSLALFALLLPFGQADNATSSEIADPGENSTFISISLDQSQIPVNAFAPRRKRSIEVSCESECRRVRHYFLEVPEGGQVAPWLLAGTSVCKSQKVADALRAARAFSVPGHPALTVGKITDALFSVGSPVYVKGGTVRDAVLGVTPKDVTLEAQCSTRVILYVCKALTGKADGACRLGNPKGLVVIGKNQAEANTDIPQGASAYNGDTTNLEYTPNQLMYDFTNDVVIDLLNGTALQHVCNKQIGISPPPGQWSKWANPNKIFLYWSLRAKGFEPANVAVQQYVVNKAKEYFDAISNDEMAFFSQQYCTHVLGGRFNPDMRPGATYTPCERCMTPLSQGANIWDNLFAKDLGNLWKIELSLPIPKLIASCLNSVCALLRFPDLCQNEDWLFFNGSCYVCDMAYTTAYSAQSACTRLANGSNLVSLHSYEEDSFVQQMTGRLPCARCGTPWVGIVKASYIGSATTVWSWMDHTRLDYENWLTGHPMDGNDCAVIRPELSTQKWFSVSCNEWPTKYVCKSAIKREAAFVPETSAFYSFGCATGWHHYNGSCYYFETNPLDRFGASFYCRQMGAVLVSIHTRGELSRVNFLRNGSSVWIDLLSIDSAHNSERASWKWESDFSDVSQNLYWEWYPDKGQQPSTEREAHCGMINADSHGYLSSSNCTQSLGFICRKPAFPHN